MRTTVFAVEGITVILGVILGALTIAGWVLVLLDLFRRKDRKLWHRIAWLVAVIVLPILGALLYLYLYATEGHRVRRTMMTEATFQTTTMRGTRIDEELHQLRDQRDAGSLTTEEFSDERGDLVEADPDPRHGPVDLDPE